MKKKIFSTYAQYCSSGGGTDYDCKCRDRRSSNSRVYDS